jgi:tetrahydromethanopterin S-methyltransferase subunit F
LMPRVRATKRCSSTSGGAICSRCPRNLTSQILIMSVHVQAQPVARESVAMVGVLVARSLGLAAGVALALLGMAALLSIA